MFCQILMFMCLFGPLGRPHTETSPPAKLQGLQPRQGAQRLCATNGPRPATDQLPDGISLVDLESQWVTILGCFVSLMRYFKAKWPVILGFWAFQIGLHGE